MAVLMRVGAFGPTVALSPDEARRLGLALQGLADGAGADGTQGAEDSESSKA